MQTCTPEWRASFLKDVTPALSKNVSIDIGMIGMQGKATETRKTVIVTKKNKQKKQKQKTQTNKHYQITFEKKVLR